MEGGGGLQATDLQRRLTTTFRRTRSPRRTYQALDQHGFAVGDASHLHLDDER